MTIPGEVSSLPSREHEKMDDATDEEEPFEEEPPPPPRIFCVSCLIPGHQGGRECRKPKEPCKNCGHEHTNMLICKDVEFALKYGGNPHHSHPYKTKDTPTEELCTNCLEMRHHSSIRCEKKEPVLVTKNVIVKEVYV